MAYRKNIGTDDKTINQGIDLIRQDIRGREFKRVYLLYGEENYLVQQYKREIADAIAPKNDAMNRNIHREEKINWSLVEDQALSMPFFSTRRVVVVENSGFFSPTREKVSDIKTRGNSTDIHNIIERVENFIPNIPDTTVMIFTERPDISGGAGKKGKVSVDRRGRLYKAVSKYGRAVEFRHPSERELGKWVILRFSSEKIRITAKALDLLLRMAGENMSHLDSEIDKLIAYAGEGGELRPRDISSIVSEVTEARVFRMINAIADHDSLTALALYTDLARLKVPPVMVLVLLMKQFGQMMLVKDMTDSGKGVKQVMSDLKVADWQARRLISQAGHFTLTQLRDVVEECVHMQEYAQSGRIDMTTALELLIVKFT